MEDRAPRGDSPPRGRSEARGGSPRRSRSGRARSPTPNVRDLLKDLKRDLGNQIESGNRDLGAKIDQMKQELTQRVDTKAAQTLEAAKAYTDEKFAAGSPQNPDTEAALLKLRAASERALRNDTAHVVLLSNYAQNDAEAARKAHIDAVLQAIGKKCKVVDHVKRGGNLTPFTRVEFENPATASLFIGKWISNKTKNSAGKPVFARTEMAKELRLMRAPLIQAEKAVKAYFRAKGEKHSVKCGNWAKGGELLVDQAPVAHLTGRLTVEWADAALAAAVSDRMDDL